MIQSGKLTEFITVLRGTEIDDGYQTNRQFAAVFKIPASVEPLSDREIFTAAAAQTQVSYRVTVRLVASFTILTTDRIEYNGQEYEVRTVKLFPRQGYAEITIG